MKRLSRLLAVYTFLLLSTSTLCVSQNQSFGIQPFNSYSGPPDNINLGNLGLHLEIPLFQDRGRGQTATALSLQYDNPVWYNDLYGAAYPSGTITPSYVGFFGWKDSFTFPVKLGTLSNAYEDDAVCDEVGNATRTYGNWSYTDANNFKHSIPGGTIDGSQCGGTVTSISGTVDGYYYQITGGVGVASTDISGISVSKYGSGVAKPFGNYTGTNLVTLFADTNGNKVTELDTYNPSSSVSTITSSSGVQYEVDVTAATGATSLPGYGLAATETYPTGMTVKYTDSSGSPRTTTVNYASYTLKTAFGKAGTVEYGPVQQELVQSVVYSDGSSYQFSYEQTPGHPESVTGRLAQLTLPTGGTIAYQYSGAFSPAASNPLNYVLSRTTQDGTTTYSETEAFTSGVESSTTKITEPSNNDTLIDFAQTLGPGGDYSPIEARRRLYQGSSSSGILLETITHCYADTPVATCATGGGGAYPTPATLTVQRTLASGQSTKSVTIYNASGLVGEVDEYGFGTSSPTRKTVTSYASLGNNINNRPQSVTVYDGAGTTIGKTTYAYDGTAVVASPASSQPTSVSGARGNLTDIYKQKDSGGATLHSIIVNDTAGMPTKISDPNGNITTYTYDASGLYVHTADWQNPDGSAINGVSHSVIANTDSNTGIVTSTTDANNQTISYTHNAGGRLTDTVYPDTVAGVHGEEKTCYQIIGQPPALGCTSLPDNTTRTTTIANPSPSTVSSQQVDGLGRVTLSTLASGATTETSYDVNGNVFCTTQPHLSGSAVNSTCKYYDALGRPFFETLPDGFSRQWCYDGIQTDSRQTYCAVQAGTNVNGSWVDFIDEAGHHSQRTYDAFNQLIKVMEPDAVSNQLSLETDYGYSSRGELVSVNQRGDPGTTSIPGPPGPRSFTYDWLSRLITSIDPERGTVCYGSVPNGQKPTSSNCSSGYDGNGNLRFRTDARGIRVSYTYDALNRLSSKTYPAGSATPSSCYSYDEATSPGGGTITNPIGRLTTEWTQTGACASTRPSSFLTSRAILAYDPMGRVTKEQQCTPANCTVGTKYALNYTYDLAGNVTKGDSGIDSIAWQLAYDTAGRLSTVTGLTPSPDPRYPTQLFNATEYGPVGITKWLMGGSSANDPALTFTKSYDNRMRVSGQQVMGIK